MFKKFFDATHKSILKGWHVIEETAEESAKMGKILLAGAYDGINPIETALKHTEGRPDRRLETYKPEHSDIIQLIVDSYLQDGDERKIVGEWSLFDSASGDETKVYIQNFQKFDSTKQTKKQDNKVVITFRGTENWTDAMDTDVGMFLGGLTITDRYRNTLHELQYTKKYLQMMGIQDKNVILAGHSLGSGLASKVRRNLYPSASVIGINPYWAAQGKIEDRDFVYHTLGDNISAGIFEASDKPYLIVNDKLRNKGYKNEMFERHKMRTLVAVNEEYSGKQEIKHQKRLRQQKISLEEQNKRWEEKNLLMTKQIEHLRTEPLLSLIHI